MATLSDDPGMRPLITLAAVALTATLAGCGNED